MNNFRQIYISKICRILLATSYHLNFAGSFDLFLQILQRFSMYFVKCDFAKQMGFWCCAVMVLCESTESVSKGQGEVQKM